MVPPSIGAVHCRACRILFLMLACIMTGASGGPESSGHVHHNKIWGEVWAAALRPTGGRQDIHRLTLRGGLISAFGCKFYDPNESESFPSKADCDEWSEVSLSKCESQAERDSCEYLPDADDEAEMVSVPVTHHGPARHALPACDVRERPKSKIPHAEPPMLNPEP